jgi:hypothetical protein
MARIAGIKYKTNARGLKTHVEIDLRKYGDNELLEDFLDLLAIKDSEGEETIDWEYIKREENKRRRIKQVEYV